MNLMQLTFFTDHIILNSNLLASLKSFTYIFYAKSI